MIIILLSNLLSGLYAAPLDDVANKELAFAKKFLKFEKIQKKHLYNYVRLLKARYLVEKEIPWVSQNIFNAIYINTQMSSLRRDDEN